jgi:hypothetical protein
VVEQLPSRCEVLSLNSSISKKGREGGKEEKKRIGLLELGLVAYIYNLCTQRQGKGLRI